MNYMFKSNHRGFLFIIVSFVIVSCMFTSCSQVSDDIQYGAIQGKVLYTNGVDHSGIVLTLDKTDGLKAIANEEKTRAIMAMSISAEDGSFSFFNLEPGTYTVYASSNDSLEKAVTANVVVRGDETAEISDMYLTATGSISGYVIVDGSETGNVGFFVFLGGTSFVSVTDDTGYYCLTGIPAGEDYQLVISKGNFTSRDVVSCTVPAHGMYNAGVTNYSSEELDSEAGVLIWKGSLAVAPEKPKTNWAYFCTEDGCSYIYNGVDWTLLAAKGEKGDQGIQGVQGEVGETGESGSNGISITWKGESAVAPAAPELYWAYFNTEDGCSYIYDGNKWTLLASRGAEGNQGEQGIQGETGASGTDGVSIIWLGSFEEEPEKSSEMNAYYNSTDGCSYIYDGNKWTLLASKGSKGDQGIQGKEGPQGETGNDGSDGISIIWKGSHASADELVNPEKLWAYFNTSDYNSYIFNGESWDILVSRGDPDANEHTYSEEWSSDSYYHWHAATCLHPELKADQSEHIWDEGVVTKEATHVVNGVMTYTCTVCGRIKKETIPAGHAYEAVVTKPTTTEQGYTTYSCTRCTDSFVSDFIDPVVVPSPTFTSQPNSLNIAPKGQGVSFSVETDTEESYTVEYQWYSSTDGTTATGIIIDDETESTLSLEAFTVKGIYYYYCVAKNVLTDDDGDSWDSPETVSDVVSVAYTGLPTVYVVSETPITDISRDEYVKATITITGAGDTDMIKKEISIKGRGNASWDLCDKKGYNIKFEKNTSVLGMNAAKKWCLVSNYFDKSLLRNWLSSLLANEVLQTNGWNPSYEYVDLYLNGEYYGNYVFVEAIQINDARIHVDGYKNLEKIKDPSKYDDGVFVLEVDCRGDSKWKFTSSICNLTFTLKDPDFDNLDDAHDYISYMKGLIDDTESNLSSGDFSSTELSSISYIDIDSFVDWYIVEELAKNLDASFLTSVFMYYNPDDQKIHMGPHWDFDHSFGNYNCYLSPTKDCSNYEGFWIDCSLSDGYTSWYEYLLLNDEFVNALKKRWQEIVVDLNMMEEVIDSKVEEIVVSAVYNFRRWNLLGSYILYDAPGAEKRVTFQSEVDFLKSWIENRVLWLSTIWGN